jgi:hypothetical protein
MPQIIIEENIKPIDIVDLKDYKVFCFNGKPEFIQVDINRFINHKRNFYDLNWNFLDVKYFYENDKNVIINKPSKLKDLLYYSAELSKGFPFVRIDFYLISNKIYFGEMTFFPEGGTQKFSPNHWNYYLGSKIQLPSKSNPWNIDIFKDF